MGSWRVEPARRSRRWVCYRQTDADNAPLYHSAGERTPSQTSGRWHRRSEGYAQYLALEPAGAWAELLRYEHLRGGARRAEYARRLWAVVVDETDIADLSTFVAYDQCGLDPRLAVGPHQEAQELAAELLAAGYRGLLSPNAALPGATNLTLFDERYEKVLTTGFLDWRSPDPERRLACHLVAECGPLVDLITKTCYIGMPHEAYRDYLRGAGRPLPRAAP